jgi:hypothetical protein
LKGRRRIREQDLRGQPGLSRDATAALVAAQPTTVREALKIPGVGRKTTRRLIELGAIGDPDDTQHAASARRRASSAGRNARDVDDRPEVQTLFSNLKASMTALEKLLEECTSHWGYEDPVYRLYHQSFKVYGLQEATTKIVTTLYALSPDRQMHPWFLQIVKDGTGKTFEREHNRRWLEVTRPIVEAFFHARYFLEMAVRYGKELKAPPRTLPSGWAAFLYLFELR